jgi:hypothetical protein
MPVRLSPDTARTVPWSAWLADSAPAFRKLAEDRDIPDSTLLTAVIIAEIEARTPYRDKERHYGRRRAAAAVRDSATVAAWLSPEESALAEQLRAEDGMGKSEWLRWLAERAVAAAVGEPEPERPAPGQRQQRDKT